MEYQQLQKWALVAEIVGGIAIVLSLVFVGLGIRQSARETELNTRAVLVNAYQTLVSEHSDFSDLQIGNEEFALASGN